LILIPEDGGDEREYVLRGRAASMDALADLADRLDAENVVFSPSPSLDIRNIPA
jgi:hypothetical protein